MTLTLWLWRIGALIWIDLFAASRLPLGLAYALGAGFGALLLAYLVTGIYWYFSSRKQPFAELKTSRFLFWACLVVVLVESAAKV